MRKSKFTDEQIASAIKQVELGVPVPEICRKLGIAEQTFYRWKKKFGALTPSEVKNLRLLEEENSKLKQIVADLSLDKLCCKMFSQKSFEAISEAKNYFVLEKAI